MSRLHREPGYHLGRTVRDHPGSGLSHCPPDPRQVGRPSRLHYGTRIGADARPARGGDQGQSPVDRTDCHSLSGRQKRAGREDCRSRQGKADRGCLGYSRRVEPRRGSRRHRPEARCLPGSRAQPDLALQSGAGELPCKHARHPRRPARGPHAARFRAGFHFIPRRSDHASHQVRTEQGARTGAHLARPRGRRVEPR